MRLRDLYFDDEAWMVRYALIDVHRWLPGRRVLISTSSLTGTVRSRRRLDTPLRSAEIVSSPSIDDRPCPVIAQAHRRRGPLFDRAQQATDRLPALVVPDVAAEPVPRFELGHQPLWSVRRLIGYSVRGLDRDMGGVDGVIVESASWEIRYVVVDTTSWVPGRRVLIPTTTATLLGPPNFVVHVGLTGAVVRRAPDYDPSSPLTARDDARLLRYYCRASRSEP